MSLIEDFIVVSNQAENADSLFSCLCEAANRLGINSSAYFLLNDHPSLSIRGRQCVASSYRKDWMDHYSENDLVRYDPIVDFSFVRPTPFSWKQLDAVKLAGPAHQRFYGDITNFSVKDAIGVPIHGPRSELACLALASSFELEAEPNFFSTVQAIGLQFHVVFGRLAARSTGLVIPILSEREREILMWSSEGKSISVVGEILNISDNTVKYHLKNAYRKLDVTDRVQAVIKAIFLGLIDPPAVRLPE